MNASTDSDTATRRLAFQKSYSLEHGGSWKRRSLIEDARFDTVTNAEFEKQERRLSHADSDEEVFPPETNGVVPGSLPTEADSGTPKQVCLSFTLKESSSSLARPLKTFENSHFNIQHIESRKSNVIGAHLDVVVIGESTRDHVVTLVKALRQSSNITNVRILKEKEQVKEFWFPKHISELDNCNHLVTKFEPDLDTGHPGFTDKAYRARRKIIADVAFEYKQGQPIPRVHYAEDEVKTWGMVYRQLVSLFPTHACSQHVEVFRLLEKESGYSPDCIPQLEDVSNFLKRRTGFSLRPVAGLLSARDFLSSLAYRVFQCTQYVRHPSSPNHSPEPDCIHELLGHVPLLADPTFAQFSQEIGLASLGASDEDIERFATLYWFTVEFGLVKQNGQVKACGAGLLSSYGELKHALSDTPERRLFEPSTTALQEYQDEDYQPVYFVSESFDDMKQKVRAYAAQIKKPFEVRYDPFTQTVQLLDNKLVIQDITNVLKAELDHLNTALCKLNNPVSNFIVEKRLSSKSVNN